MESNCTIAFQSARSKCHHESGEGRDSRDEIEGKTHELNDVDDWNLGGILDGTFTVLLSNERPEFVEVEGWSEAVVAVQVEMSHTDLSEVAGMVFVEVNSVMVHATSVTTTSGMLTVLA